MSAEVKSIGGGAVEPPALREPVAIQGWAFDCFDHVPPVIANPGASAQALSAWALGQLSQANLLMGIIGCSSNACEWEPSVLAGAIRHFTEQAQAALAAAIEVFPRGDQEAQGPA